MTSLALSLCLLALGAEDNSKLYPLAAALVLDGKLTIADVPTRELRPVPLLGLSPQQADLSFDRKNIVVSAISGDDVAHLYLVDPTTGQYRKLPAGDDTRQSFPRFADDGTSVVFTSSSLPGKPVAPDRVRRLHIADGTVEDIPGQPTGDNRTPVSWDGARVAFVSGTGKKLDLQVENVTTQVERPMARLAGASSELTTSPDHKKLVYTNKEHGKLKFYMAQGDGAPKSLATIPTDGTAIQPRFVCPRDVLFVREGKVWVLNSDTGLVTELSGFNEATGRELSADAKAPPAPSVDAQAK